MLETMILIIVAGPVWTVIVFLLGVRVGKQIVGYPVAPIIAPESPKPVYEDDPYDEPMNGPRKNQGTVES